ncbi:hypothetical protein CRM22_003153 [Opisthorchis felineus]|uniref:G-protein coupled receptors family 1 profile domain-containing protein n=1 Tax=Opisthorchis felineus TaxID=147828 RepID=A0A4S2M7G0_OPIFE|nr:hypothetical protein CRM22_003153 [Opisthorchis felineus]
MLANGTQCRPYLQWDELYASCRGYTFTEKFIVLFTGVAGVVIFYVLLFGTLGNVAIIMFLSFKCRLAQNLSYWGRVCAIIDLMFYLIFYFGCDISQTMEAFWLRSHLKLHKIAYLLCRISGFTWDFFLSLRLNFAFFLLLHMSGFNISNSFTFRGTKTLLFFLISSCLAFISAAPSAFVNGLWQTYGAFICSPDPMWAYEYHLFYQFHKVLLIEGLVQSVCIILLCYALWRRQRRNKGIISYLTDVSDSSTVPGMLITGYLLELQDYNSNCFTVIIHVLSIALCRLLACAVRFAFHIAHLLNVYLQQDAGSRSDILNEKALRSLCSFVEIAIASCSTLWWIARHQRLATRKPIDKRKPKKCSSIFHAKKIILNRRYYYEQVACKYRGGRKQLKHHHQEVENLKNLKSKLYYENQKKLRHLQTSESTAFTSLRQFENHLQRQSTTTLSSLSPRDKYSNRS